MTENENYVGEEDRVGTDWKAILVRDRWRFVGIALAVLAVAAYLGYDIEIPRWLRLYVTVVALTGALGYPVAARIVQWLYSPNYTYLVEVDARDSELAIWQLPPSVWRGLDVTDGELHEVRATAPAWECQEYDPEENEAVGTWRGSASDLELIEQRERIDEIRGELEELAQEGLTIRVKQSGIIRKSVRGIVMSFVEGFEKESLYDGEQIQNSVEEALTHWKTDPDDDGDGSAPGDDGTEAEPNQKLDPEAVAVNGSGGTDAD